VRNLINAETSLYCIIGDPIRHALSPFVQTELFRRYGLNAVYLAFQVKRKDLKEVIKAIKILGIRGFNVTMPLKVDIMDYLDHVSESSMLTGAVNTVKNTHKELVGYNTDVDGVIYAFKKAGMEVSGRRIAIVGAGGAARAVVAALYTLGVKELIVVNRTLERGLRLARHFKDKVRIDVLVLGSEEAREAILRSEILINATSVGLRSDEMVIDSSLLEGREGVFDVVHVPPRTRFIREAENRGIKAAYGLDMFIGQAVESFRVWTGIKPDSELVRNIVLKGLGIERRGQS